MGVVSPFQIQNPTSSSMSIFYPLLFSTLVILLFYLVFTLWRDGRYYYLGLNLPARRNEWPFVGSTLALLGSLEHASKQGIAIYEENRDKPVFCSWTGPILLSCTYLCICLISVTNQCSVPGPVLFSCLVPTYVSV
uniref:Uncharacterized protein n=1 Tax=Cacopsylla melanoneura TaxID=428564 RepID=A0A8D8XAI8_9HEMI